MKGRTFLILGGVVIVGVASYAVYKHVHRFKTEKHAKTMVEKDVLETASDTFYESHTPSAADVYKIKETTANAVRERHNDMAVAMEEALNTIFKNSVNNEIVTENSEVFGETGRDLDCLLK